jgi:hypothetical protein
MRFIRSSLLKDHTTATEVKKIDLPVNPLSHLIISMDGYNATDEATLAEIAAFINKVEVTYLGTTIISLESEDLIALNAYLYKAMPVLTQSVATDNAARCLTLIVPFGRTIFNPAECFPATKKGELTLSLDTTVPATSFDNSTLNVEAVELLDAAPEQYLKSTLLTVSAPGATGDNDIDLPIGNDIAAILVRMTTFPSTSSHTYGVDSVKILVDNKEEGYSYARAQCLTGDMIHRLHTLPRDIAAFGDVLPANVVWLDYDPHTDNNFLLETAGKSSVKIRLGMGVDEATKLTVLELVKMGA